MTEGFDRYAFAEAMRERRTDTAHMEFTEIDIKTLKIHAEKLSDNVFSTAPIDKSKARAAIHSLYKSQGLKEPKIFWTKSPAASIFTKVIVDASLGRRRTEDPYHQHGVTLWGPVGNIVSVVESATHDFALANSSCLKSFVEQHSSWRDFGYRNEWAVLHNKTLIEESLEQAIRRIGRFSDCEEMTSGQDSQMWNEIHEGVEDYLGAPIENEARRKLLKSVKVHLKGFLEANRHAKTARDGEDRIPDFDLTTVNYLSSAQRSRCYTQYDLAKFAEYKFLSHAGYISTKRILDCLYDLSGATGWVFPDDEECYVSARPEILNMDDAGLPHCDTGPSIMYPDGFAVYAWHGVPFPHEWVHKPPAPAEAMQWLNLEQRRVACEMLGWERIIDELEAETIDKDNNPEIGELIAINLPRVETEKFLRVRCGTGREFVLPVPPEMRTAQQANAWTWGLESGDYKPEVRT